MFLEPLVVTVAVNVTEVPDMEGFALEAKAEQEPTVLPEIFPPLRPLLSDPLFAEALKCLKGK